MLYDLIDHDLIDVINHSEYKWEDAVKETTRYLQERAGSNFTY